MDGLVAVEAVETCGGEDESVALAGGEFFEAGVDVAADFNKGDVRAKGEDLSAAVGALLVTGLITFSDKLFALTETWLRGSRVSREVLRERRGRQ